MSIDGVLTIIFIFGVLWDVRSGSLDRRLGKQDEPEARIIAIMEMVIICVLILFLLTDMIWRQ